MILGFGRPKERPKQVKVNDPSEQPKFFARGPVFPIIYRFFKVVVAWVTNKGHKAQQKRDMFLFQRWALAIEFGNVNDDS